MLMFHVGKKNSKPELVVSSLGPRFGVPFSPPSWGLAGNSRLGLPKAEESDGRARMLLAPTFRGCSYDYSEDTDRVLG